ncbi:MAG: thiol oxidoreductase [Planctomycetaceae bacterium]|nr:thiol oxidoreductase [Planctomycetaceae bacterium]
MPKFLMDSKFAILILMIMSNCTALNGQQKISVLYDAQTGLEPETTFKTTEALITRISDRVRDRHAREKGAYNHYLNWYWQQRTVEIEIVDRVATGGTDITINISSLTPLNKPDFRCFFRGINTVAEYHHNVAVKEISANQYSTTISYNNIKQRGLKIGDLMEFEFSPFLVKPTNGRSNYYGTAILYVIGSGIVPWQGTGDKLDSKPLPDLALLAGRTTLPYQYSDEPQHRFMQMMTNIAPLSGQSFTLGRRLHHTDFETGAHSEQPNPPDPQQAGKLGPDFVARSCIACHVNNGRALPPAINEPMHQSVVKVGANAQGHAHPQLGSTLQSQSTSDVAESTMVLSRYERIRGEYEDGMPFELRRPIYAFKGTSAKYYSVRLTPPLVGLGLLEAIKESSITSMADPQDANGDGISGRLQTVPDPESNRILLGRFGYKGGQAAVRHQIGAAFNTDMGVTTNLFPALDGTSEPQPPEITDAQLAHLTRYISTLGVNARRDIDHPIALRGENLFASAGCTKCHHARFTTSPFHPLAELRSRTIRPYTDLLLHDMGAALADNLDERQATGAEWRTAPLWGIGLTTGISGGEAYLHDGRARTLAEAILWHGGEGEQSMQAFRTMPLVDRNALLMFIKSL